MTRPYCGNVSTSTTLRILTSLRVAVTIAHPGEDPAVIATSAEEDPLVNDTVAGTDNVLGALLAKVGLPPR